MSLLSARSPGRIAAVATAAIAVGLPSLASAETLGIGGDQILVQAHRGGPGLGAPQNSLKLFGKAVDSGLVDIIELDVRRTADNQVVVYHDEKLARNCTLRGAAIQRLDWSQLKQVRCAGEPIPSLAQALDAVRGTPVRVNIDFKLERLDKHPRTAELVKATAQVVREAKLPFEQVGFVSYYWRAYAKLLQQYGDGWRFTAMEFPTRSEPTDAIYSNVRRAKSLGITGYALTIRHAPTDLLEFITEYGEMEIHLAGRRNQSDHRFALANGVRVFSGNNPAQKVKKVQAILDQVQAEPLSPRITTTEIRPTTLLANRNLSAGSQTTLAVIGRRPLLPSAVSRQLHTIWFEATVSGNGKGTLELAPLGSREGIDGVRIRIPKGTRSYPLYASPGDYGKIRVTTSEAARVSLRMVSYQRVDY